MHCGINVSVMIKLRIIDSYQKKKNKDIMYMDVITIWNFQSDWNQQKRNQEAICG
jgi:hypothetical protein